VARPTETAARILRGSGDNEANRRFLETLERALPEREFLPVTAWLSTFYGFQQNWLLDTARFAVTNKCRQIGYSHTAAAAAILWALLAEDTSIVSVGERESSEVLRKVARHAQALMMLGSEWAKPRAASATRITLATGGTVVALPATSGGRGQSGNMLLDEVAYYERPAEVWDGASATVLHGFRMRIGSTPNGVGNLFHQLVRDHEKLGYRLHEVTLEQAIADGLNVDEEQCWKMARGDPRLFDQLFHCSFLDSELQYIPSEFITRATVDRLDDGGDVYAGLDIGETRDRTVLVLARKVGKIKTVFHVESHKRTDDSLLDGLVGKAFGFHRAKRLCADATGLGSMPATRFKQRHGEKFEAVDFTLKSKEEMATGLYSALAEEELRLPKTLSIGTEDEAALLRGDISSIRRVVSDAGNVKYEAPRTDAGHADRAWALMLALRAAQNSFSYGRLQ
jgi:phage FluMu gp28-like protein